MKIGKLPNSLLNKIIIEPINTNAPERKEVLLKPSVGEDCAALDFGGYNCIMSTDPITGAVKDIGKLAVHININDIASSGGEPVGIMLTALLPPSITEKEISDIITDLYTEANKLNVAILGGHTEITDAVTKPVISCTAVGKCRQLISTGGSHIGDYVIMTKTAGLEGTAIFAKDKYSLLKDSVDEETIRNAEKFSESLSVLREGLIGAEYGAHAMHDVTEGGILGACWELAEGSGLGIEVYEDKIPIAKETREICNVLGADPLRLISSGAMLIVCQSTDILRALEKENIKASVIGRITPKDRYIIRNNEKIPLTEPDSDELYRV